MDLYGGQTVTGEVELSLHFETGRVPLQNHPVTAAGECLLTVVLIPCVHCESSNFMSVFSQLFVAGHALSVNDVDYGVLRANPHLLLDQSQHAVLVCIAAHVQSEVQPDPVMG